MLLCTLLCFDEPRNLLEFFYFVALAIYEEHLLDGCNALWDNYQMFW